MRKYRKYETIKTWGNHIDPEISAEEYLNSKNIEVATWAGEHQSELHQLDRDSINLYRRYRNKANIKNLEQLYETKTRRRKVILPSKGSLRSDFSSVMIREIYSSDPGAGSTIDNLAYAIVFVLYLLIAISKIYKDVKKFNFYDTKETELKLIRKKLGYEI